jgi:tRNA(His) 5'-end guanylyltransferase
MYVSVSASTISSIFDVESDSRFYGRDEELDSIQCTFWGSKFTKAQSCQVQSFTAQVRKHEVPWMASQ